MLVYFHGKLVLVNGIWCLDALSYVSKFFGPSVAPFLFDGQE